MKEYTKTVVKIFTFFFCTVIMAFLILCILEYFVDKFSSAYTLISEYEYVSSWDGSEDYLFSNEADVGNEADEVEDSIDSLATDNLEDFQWLIKLPQIIIKRFETITNNWTKRVTDSFPFYYNAVLANMWLDKLYGFNITTSVSAKNDTLDTADVVVRLDDGSYARIVDEDSALIYGSENIESLIDFGLSMEAEGRNFLYVSAPAKIELAEYIGLISEVYPDSSSEISFSALEALDTAGLDTLSMLDAMNENEIASLDAFYQTDHHWTARTGLFACRVLSESLNQLYGYDIDTSRFDIENYTVTLLEDYWYGSLGRKAADPYHTLDDFELILPNYETNLEVYLSRTDTTYLGSAEETLFDLDSLTGYYNKLEFTPYNIYSYGSMAYISIHNNDVDNGKRLLIIKTSYVNCMVPYLASAVEYLDVIDLRHFEGSLESLIEDVNPDTVVVFYNTTALAYENTWDHTSLFDFR